MDWKAWIGRRIFVILTNGLKYSGTIVDADENFINIRDKFDCPVTFKVKDISIIQEKKEGGYG